MSEAHSTRTMHLPCPNCGAEAKDGENTKTQKAQDFEFAGKTATREWPAKVCPECGEVFPI